MNKRDYFCTQEKRRKVLDLIFTFITVAIIVISGVALLGQLAGLHLYSVESGSMTPEYPVDSLIIVREVEPESIQLGDVITFVANADGMVVTHRVVSKDPVERTFTTKGDANDVNDAVPVLWKNTVGKVVFGIPLLGGPFSVMSAKGCRWLITGIAAVFLLLSLGRSFYRDRKENKGAAESDT